MLRGIFFVIRIVIMRLFVLNMLKYTTSEHNAHILGRIIFVQSRHMIIFQRGERYTVITNAQNASENMNINTPVVIAVT